MTHRRLGAASALLSIALSAPSAGAAPNAPLAPGNFFAVLQRTTGLSDPIGVTSAGDGTNRLFMLERDGRIRVFNGAQLLATPFLDITSLVVGGGEQGLLGIAFHPDYENNGFFYVNYTCDAPAAPGCTGDGDTIVARYQVSASNPNVADASSASVMIVVDQPFANHNGGHLAFGLDGFLYIALGDGGDGHDTLEVAQDLSRRAGNRGLLGKMLRIDVDQNVSQAPFYGIPAGNPWTTAGDPTDAIPDEVWAFGLRNPWRYSFDRVTGDLYIGDVGQSTREEATRLPAPLAPGQNFGWDVLEGTFCHEDAPSGACASLLAGNSVLPILEYGRNEGSTIIGGHVYRGRPASQLLTGHYVFADLGSSRVWRGIRPASGPWTKELLFTTGAGATSFGEDDQGGLYFVGLFDGGLYEIQPYTFADTPPTSFGWSFVESVFEAGITSGCGGDNFCPAAPTTRGEMAVFLLRASEGASYTPPPCSGPTFDDVPCTHPFADWIYDLVARGITAGCSADNYCPALPVTRQEMAVFLLLSAEAPGYTPPPCTSPTFNDVPCSSGFAPWVEELVRRGITGGCGGGSYCPAGTVTRAQMAVFLVATFGLVPV
jgi:glucose/arabinose dehydrogenase